MHSCVYNSSIQEYFTCADERKKRLLFINIYTASATFESGKMHCLHIYFLFCYTLCVRYYRDSESTPEHSYLCTRTGCLLLKT